MLCIFLMTIFFWDFTTYFPSRCADTCEKARCIWLSCINKISNKQRKCFFFFFSQSYRPVPYVLFNYFFFLTYIIYFCDDLVLSAHNWFIVVFFFYLILSLCAKIKIFVLFKFFISTEFEEFSLRHNLRRESMCVLEWNFTAEENFISFELVKI
jgi:hypothetical protein